MISTSSRRGIAILILSIIYILQSCAGNLTHKKLVYSNDFENNLLKNITMATVYGNVTDNRIYPFRNSQVLGPFNNTVVTLSLDSLPSHDYLQIEFDLYIQDAWAGDYTPPGSAIPDIWNLSVNTSYIISTTFSNITASPQSFPNWYGTVPASPARGNAADTLLPGRCQLKDSANGTTHYKISYTVVHSANAVTFQCNDALQGDVCQKSWSIDNLKIYALKN